MRRTILLSVVIIAYVATIWPPAGIALFGAGDVVLDPTNLVQNTRSAINSEMQVANQGRQIVNEITMIRHMMTNLETLSPTQMMNLVTAMDGSLHRLSNATGIPYETAPIVREMQRLYWKFGSAWPGWGVYATQRNEWNDQIRRSVEDAVVMQGVYADLEADRGRLDSLIATSQGATGNLSAIQAQSQLVAQNTAQLMRSQAVDSASYRVLAIQAMKEASEEDANRAYMEHLMTGYGEDQARPVFGKGLP